MAKIREKIIAEAVKILDEHPKGVKFSQLNKQVSERLPDLKRNTVFTIISRLDIIAPKRVYKPARGLYQHISFKEKSTDEYEELPEVAEKTKEEDFYKPFADWLVNESEECTKAIPLGRNKFGGKWGTPDVIGKRESARSDILKALSEIVSAEIKLDTKELITAFGQACSYKLFSHKCYIVVPKAASQDDVSRLDSLCLIFGIGLVLFDNTNVENPQFEIRVRPRKHEPDMFYVNKYMKLIEKDLFS